MTLKVGCVRACVREEVINGGSLSFPAHSSRWGGGCGLVGWVTRIMNLPVVLFNTKKGKGKQKHKQQSRLAFTQTVYTSNQGDKVLKCLQWFSQITFCHICRGTVAKRTTCNCLDEQMRKILTLELNIIGGVWFEIPELQVHILYVVYRSMYIVCIFLLVLYKHFLLREIW